MDRDEYWRATWLSECSWHALFLLLLAAVLCLWQPSSLSQLLQQSDELQSDDREEEKKDIELTRQDNYSKKLFEARGPHSFSIED